MRLLFRLSILVAITAVVASAMPANAICALPSTFNGAYSYLTSPVGIDLNRVRGDFWGLGQGNVASPAGADNGTAANSYWIRTYTGNEYYIAGDWAGDPAIDGCIQDPPNPQPAHMVYSLQDADTACGYFTLQCVEENALGNFDYSVNGLSNPMVAIPAPVITASTRPDANSLSVTATHAAVPAGAVLTDGTCGGNLIAGFDLYYMAVPRDAAAPATRDPGSWTLLGSGGVGGSVQGNIACPSNLDVYLAVGLTFDSGFKTHYLSCDSTKVQCGPQVAIRPADDFRVVPRPDRKPVRTR